MSTKFRPCIDLHQGRVKQIVGGTLTDSEIELKTNFVSNQDASAFVELYRQHELLGGHVIKLGDGNDAAARAALQAWPGGLQLGGSINSSNAAEWLEAGAEKLIVTSWLFPNCTFSIERLAEISSLIGRDRLVVDLSCRCTGDGWTVAINKWQTLTDMQLNGESLHRVARFCSEFLIHAADVEGLCCGIDERLVKMLASWSPLPCTYAGGGRRIEDLDLVDRLSNGRVDVTFGSALDIFGGSGIKLVDCIKWNREHSR